jgi:hypothetical protein
MAYDDRPVDAEKFERLGKKRSLSGSSPCSHAWALTMPKSRAIESYGAKRMVRSNIHDAADVHVLDCHAVAMQKDDRAATASLNVVQANAVARDERPAWRVCLFRLRCLSVGDGSTARQG